MGKKISLITTVIVLLVGLVLLFIPSIDMERYRIFTTSFAPFAVTLMISIGTNSALDTIQKNEK